MKRFIYFIIVIGLLWIGYLYVSRQGLAGGFIGGEPEGIESSDGKETADAAGKAKDGSGADNRIHKIVTQEDLLKLKGQIFGIDFEHRFNIGDRRIAIPIEVTLKAYVDFSTFSARNVEQRGSFIHITLPDPKIALTSSKVDHQGIRQFTSLWRSAYTDEEMSEFTRQGVESVLAEVPDMRLLHTARDCAAQTLIPLLTSLGYQEDHIIITFREGVGTESIEGLEKIKEISHEVH